MNSSGPPEGIKERTILFRPKPKILLLDLAPSGVYLDSGKRNSQNETSDITAGAVGSYPAFSPLSRPLVGTVFFLWHLPYPDKVGTPGVTRHSVLRCSDFPLLTQKSNEQQLPNLNHQFVLPLFLF